MVKEEKAKEYAENLMNESRPYHVEKYGMERAKRMSDFDIYYIQEAFESGWDACMKYLKSLPLDEAANRILYHGTKIGDKSTFND